MKYWKWIFYEDIKQYQYFMNAEKIKSYQKAKLICACIPLCYVGYAMVIQQSISILMLIIAMLFCYKIPFFLLKSKHIQNCNNVIAAIPLWMNHLYALLEKNTIHNAIVNSLHTQTPIAIYSDLKRFIELIENDPSNKQAYYQFLACYQVEGFFDIMMKLYEFRNLSKEKLKYEIRFLNENLQAIETMKRQNQFKNEVFIGDTCTCFILFIPCIYMTLIALMPTLFQI